MAMAVGWEAKHQNNQINVHIVSIWLYAFIMQMIPNREHLKIACTEIRRRRTGRLIWVFFILGNG